MVTIRLIILTALAVTSTVATAQPVGTFDVSAPRIASLAEPAWTQRNEGHRTTYLCVAAATCPTPTAVEIKGVVRAERLPEAFSSGPLSPATLEAHGRANAARLGSEFVLAQPLRIAGFEGIAMEAAAGPPGGRIHFVSRWLGQGNRLLDIKVTSPDLALARRLADEAATALAPHVLTGQ